VEQSGSSSGS